MNKLKMTWSNSYVGYLPRWQNLDSIASNGRATDKLGRGSCRPYYPCIFVEGLRKTIKTFGQCSKGRGRHSKWAPSKWSFNVKSSKSVLVRFRVNFVLRNCVLFTDALGTLQSMYSNFYNRTPLSNTYLIQRRTATHAYTCQIHAWSRRFPKVIWNWYISMSS
jgi:hypothetical protein